MSHRINFKNEQNSNSNSKFKSESKLECENGHIVLFYIETLMAHEQQCFPVNRAPWFLPGPLISNWPEVNLTQLPPSLPLGDTG